MIDCSSLPFEENVRITRQVVEYAHERGVVVEAELGTLAGVEDEVNVSAEASSYTRPEDVQEFVERTGCDSLAICLLYTSRIFRNLHLFLPAILLQIAYCRVGVSKFCIDTPQYRCV